MYHIQHHPVLKLKEISLKDRVFMYQDGEHLLSCSSQTRANLGFWPTGCLTLCIIPRCTTDAVQKRRVVNAKHAFPIASTSFPCLSFVKRKSARPYRTSGLTRNLYHVRPSSPQQRPRKPKEVRWDLWSTPRPDHFNPGKNHVPTVQEAGGGQGRFGQGRKISPSTGIRSPDRPARSESLY